MLLTFPVYLPYRTVPYLRYVNLKDLQNAKRRMDHPLIHQLHRPLYLSIIEASFDSTYLGIRL